MIEFLLFIWLLNGCLVAYIAGAKRRNWFLWLIASLVLGFIALLAVIGMPTKKPSRRDQLESGKVRECPACRELIHAQASKCPHCQTESEPLPERTWWGAVKPVPIPGAPRGTFSRSLVADLPIKRDPPLDQEGSGH